MDELDKTILITGITGQCGSIMADYLLYKGYTKIHGIVRRSAVFNTKNIDHIFDKVSLHHGDITDSMSMYNTVNLVRPDYLFNFAAMSHVAVSESLQRYTIETNTIGLLNVLQAVKSVNCKCKVYHASTSEEYGNTTDGGSLLNEDSKKNPVSIYGVSKLAAEGICNMYRDAYGMFIVTSTLFNHESPRRGRTFVSQKICDYVVKYTEILEGNSEDYSEYCEDDSGGGSEGYEDGGNGEAEVMSKEGRDGWVGGGLPPLQLGNLDSRRDWGYAGDYIEGIYSMMIQDTPDNFVLATGVTRSVREFVEMAFRENGISIVWEGEGISEKGLNSITKDVVVEVNEKYYRPIDIQCLIGDASKAKRILNWEPRTSFKNLIRMMINASATKDFTKFQWRPHWTAGSLHLGAT